ncbi:hypothetical protein Cgig2_007722 [Carnegiea gigantea]|uniref:Uncharacterized protein n=1 Tax=Carnegiea gigantea TaxID=171969 RepID=A0A9Q1K8Z2_9CARY|nr:hypothetical protein Cgig2_007722 [Carnegiea gigantea]
MLEKMIEYGEITLSRIHDLMHDIALEAAGQEIYIRYSITTKFGIYLILMRKKTSHTTSTLKPSIVDLMEDLKALINLKISYGLGYTENINDGNKNDGLTGFEVKRFFPSLEWFELKYLPKLKSDLQIGGPNWREQPTKDDEMMDINNKGKPFDYKALPELDSIQFLACPTLENLGWLGKFHENLRVMISGESGTSKLKDMETNNISWP